MSKEFIRKGEIQDITSYPAWIQALLTRCAADRETVVNHEVFQLMRDVQLGKEATHRFMVGVWPTIVQFPQYMAFNLLKVKYGSSRGHDMARKFLIRNIRVEQLHADMWLDWAEASGVSRQEVLQGTAPTTTSVLADWCWGICSGDNLAAAMAATNYAIEGATGEWAEVVCSRDDYALSFSEAQHKPAMRWLRQHAKYDDVHPWEALEIITTLMGEEEPVQQELAHLEQCIRTSYRYMSTTLDDCLKNEAVPQQDYRVSEA